jgi:hypothetical protein
MVGTWLEPPRSDQHTSAKDLKLAAKDFFLFNSFVHEINFICLFRRVDDASVNFDRIGARYES